MFKKFKKWREDRKLASYFERNLTLLDVIQDEVNARVSNKKSEPFITNELIDALGKKSERYNLIYTKLNILEAVILAVLLLIAWKIDIGFSLAGISLQKLDNTKEILFALAGALSFLGTVLQFKSEFLKRVVKAFIARTIPNEMRAFYIMKHESYLDAEFLDYFAPDFERLGPRVGYVVQIAIFFIYLLFGLILIALAYAFAYLSVGRYILENPSWPGIWSPVIAWSVIVLWAFSFVVAVFLMHFKVRMHDKKFRIWLRELGARDPIQFNKEIDALLRGYRRKKE